MVNAQITVTNSRFLDEIGDMTDAKHISRGLWFWRVHAVCA